MTDNLERQSDEKVEAILAGAMREFLTHGYAATTMDRVTAAAGVSKATVYSYFQDKEGLFTALIKKLAREKCYAVFKQNQAQKVPASIVLRQFAAKMLDNILEDQQLVLPFMRLIIGESGRFPELARAFVENLEKSSLEDLSQFLASCTELNISDPQATARIFVGTLVHFILVQEVLHGKDIVPMERDRLIDNLINLIVVNDPTLQLDQFSGTKQKSLRRNRDDSGKFEPDDHSCPKRLRSIRLTDTAWENLAAIAAKHKLSRTEVIEIFARDGELS
ncbi:TetR/AcrR family transcriptional regulator [Iningainema tapete]|uniref:TetR/AcrR family transcriptional regulator n=1 Tax=Iningainema tapete BLCC-T55 TaxID=2748662 RepID=A0A8J6XE97_9CYAN|nr:TetR/AcrR family transcriptional regulator [Iningainema tapete]MBD2773889.1 TetR/AcrR family transcriptional regulator [Iningainema tapete BLCC-T55]